MGEEGDAGVGIDLGYGGAVGLGNLHGDFQIGSYFHLISPFRLNSLCELASIIGEILEKRKIESK